MIGTSNGQVFESALHQQAGINAFEAPEQTAPQVQVAENTPSSVTDAIPEGWSSVGELSQEDQLSNKAAEKGKIRGSLDFETKSGKSGLVTYFYDPEKKNIHIGWMGAQFGTSSSDIKSHELGVDKVQDILKTIAERHPEAETFSAVRTGGARQKAGTTGMVIRSIPDRGFGAPGQRLTDLY